MGKIGFKTLMEVDRAIESIIGPEPTEKVTLLDGNLEDTRKATQAIMARADKIEAALAQLGISEEEYFNLQ